jgi:DNA helicase-2/ATP-dependent DNA helicase PcrA
LHVLFSFLEHVTLVSDADAVDPKNGAVTLMTLHAAKGLEFDFVAIAGLEEGVLPHERSLYENNQMEEERRLCYVGITRARKHLLLTNARRRTQRGLSNRTMASRFIREMAGGSGESVSLHEEVAADNWKVPSQEDVYQDEITVGTIVRHKRFGLGKVQRIIRRSRGSTVTVQFRGGVKHLVLEYANLEIVPPGISPDF